jgi:acyl dehydratase
MVKYDPKDWITFIFRFHKSDTFRQLYPMMIFIGLYSAGICYLEVEYWKLSQESHVKNISIMHGMLGAALFSKIFGTLFPGEGTIYLGQTLNFLRPMYAGKEYEAVFTVKEVNTEKHRAIVETKIIDPETQKVVTVGEATVMNEEKIK